jgi:beta-glucosidase
LSYTTFKYSNLKLGAKEISADGSLKITADIKNTGKVEGKEVVELYISALKSSVPRAVKELKSFAKVDLKPGETKTVTFTINKDALSFYDVSKHAWKAEPGEFSVLLGASSKDIRLKDNFRLK